MAKTPLLIILLPSSGCDLGRWILAHYGVEYRERPHAPIFHVLALKAWGAGKDDYPLYVEADRKTKITNVRKLAEHFDGAAAEDKKLFPNPKAEPELADQMEAALEYYHTHLSNRVVFWSYWNFLKYKSLAWPSMTTKVPFHEKLICWLAFPVIRSLMYAGLKLDQSVADEALKSIYAGFDHYDAMLSDGRPYLSGERMTYADIGVAASLAPMILAQGYHGMLPNHAKCPVFMQKIYTELRQRPTGLFIQRLYDEHRPAQLLQV